MPDEKNRNRATLPPASDTDPMEGQSTAWNDGTPALEDSGETDKTVIRLGHAQSALVKVEAPREEPLPFTDETRLSSHRLSGGLESPPAPSLETDSKTVILQLQQPAQYASVMEPSAEGSKASQVGPGWPHQGRVTLGDTLSERYLLEQVIGGGGMGIVFKARDNLLYEAGKYPYVALKVLGEDFKSHPDAWRQLIAEMEKARSLSHHNIIKVYDIARDPLHGEYFMTMEYLKGKSLEQLIQENPGRPLETGLAFSILEGIVSALEYAHARNIVHSDIKPNNVFLTADNVVKVLDFGIAREIRKGESKTGENLLRADEFTAYTIAYANIEMMEGCAPDPRDDIYSLACIAYKLLSGQHPFGPEGERYGARYAFASGLEPIPIKGLGKRQWRALAQGLAFARKDRTPSAAKFLNGIAPHSSYSKIALAVGSGVALAGLVASGVHFYSSSPDPELPVKAMAAGQKPEHLPSPDQEMQALNVGQPGREPSATVPTESVPPGGLGAQTDKEPAQKTPSPHHESVDTGTPQPPPPSAEQRLLELVGTLKGLTVSMPKTAYRDKEQIPLAIDVPSAASLHVFLFQPGELPVLLFPNKRTADNHTQPGRKGIDHLRASPPYGKAWFIAVAEPEDINLYRQYAHDAKRGGKSWLVLSQEELLEFLDARIAAGGATKIGTAEMTACPAKGACK